MPRSEYQLARKRQLQLAPHPRHGCWQKHSPWHHPDQRVQPEQPHRRLPIVMRNALAQKTRDMFVVEIEPRPSSLRRKLIARRHRNRRVADRREKMPRQSDRKKNQCAGHKLQLQQQAQLPCDRQIQDHKAQRKDQADQTLRQQVERKRPCEQQARHKRRTFLTQSIQRDKKAMHAKRHPQADEQIGNEESRVKIWPDCRSKRQRPVERSTLLKQTQPKRIDRKEQRQHGNAQWQPSSPVMLAENAHRASRHPVHQRRLIEEAYAIDIGRDEVVPMQHLARNLDVDGVHIIQQSRRKEARKPAVTTHTRVMIPSERGLTFLIVKLRPAADPSPAPCRSSLRSRWRVCPAAYRTRPASLPAQRPTLRASLPQSPASCAELTKIGAASANPEPNNIELERASTSSTCCPR